MSQAPGPTTRSQVVPETLAQPESSQVQAASQAFKTEDIKPDHSQDPSYVNLKVKQQVPRLQTLNPEALNLNQNR